MAINKSHAILFLTGTIGVSDGEWTLEEITEASKNGGLDKYLTDGADWHDKVEKGELTTETAIKQLKSPRASTCNWLVGVTILGITTYATLGKKAGAVGFEPTGSFHHRRISSAVT